MSANQSGLVVVRYGEIALKGRNRPRFIRQLCDNIAACLRRNGIRGEVSVVERRLSVSTGEPESCSGPHSRCRGDLR